MREILFKAKRLNTEEWVLGYYVKLNNKHYIVPDYASAWYGIEVDPKTVCQYTDLTDTNDTKIFEGDVCRCGGYVGIISYCEMDAMYVYTYDGNIQAHFGNIWGTELEVIGNIHDEEA